MTAPVLCTFSSRKGTGALCEGVRARFPGQGRPTDPVTALGGGRSGGQPIEEALGRLLNELIHQAG